MARSEASPQSSAEVRRLWEEPTEEIGLKSDSVGILALLGPGGCQRTHKNIGLKVLSWPHIFKIARRPRHIPISERKQLSLRALSQHVLPLVRLTT
jgi:hypothetical protein